MTTSAAHAVLFQMKRIRLVEEEIARRYDENKMRCPTHLCVGQEAVAAAVGFLLRRDDLAVSGHRAHGHYLGKGGNLPAMLAEIYGKATGCARGRGGSMHLVDEAAGFMGSTAIVAGTVPIGVGLAYGIKLKRTDQVSCVFLGDAAAEAGVFFESVNFAVLKRLPVLFICENNLYSVCSPLRVRQPEGRAIHEMVGALGLPSTLSDGNNARDVLDHTTAALAAIRAGGGPRFLEFSTYRWLEHCGPGYDNDLGYRSEAEFLEWKAREPIGALADALLAAGDLSHEQIHQMDHAIAREVEDAFAFAEASPFPDPASANAFLYAGCTSAANDDL